ncbi:hypothetical protein SALCHL_000891 [Streptomyces albus subsp. chlorinus]|uniref:hypothetical protein n=1 Tax=Streptomyces albus TaxID=1888 RepID=UPI0031F669C5
MSDRRTSRLGPLVSGLTYRLTGDHRHAILSLVLFPALGFAPLSRVPVRRATAAVGNVAPGRI